MATNLHQFAKKNGVKYFFVSFVDLFGVLRSKLVPATAIDEIQSEGAGFAGFATWLDMSPADSDMFGMPDGDSVIQLPWNKEIAWVASDLYMDGKPVETSPRIALKRQIEKAAKKNLYMKSGVECEFFLVNEDGTSLSDQRDTQAKPCYDSSALMRRYDVITEICDSMIALGWKPYQNDHEDANGQFEINYTYSDALNAADKYVFFRMAAGEIAQEFDLIASFMPKLFRNKTGNGMHMHVSAQKGNKKNAFEDKSDRQGLGLSKLGYHFLAGILKHARALTAFSAPSVNSYKRLVVGESMSGATWAPAYVTYGDNNRSAMVRVPFGRLEYRLADSSCNPYLAMAAMLAAGMDGITKALNPGPAMNVNLYEMSESQKKKNKIEVLPQNLGEALDELEKDRFFRNALGGSIVDEFLKIKRMEWVDYCRHVSDWEKDRYIEFY